MLESVQAAHDQPSWNGSSSETLEANRVDEQQRIEREKSHTSQNIDPDVVIVDWNGPNDPENPYVGVPSHTKPKLIECAKVQLASTKEMDSYISGSVWNIHRPYKRNVHGCRR